MPLNPRIDDWSGRLCWLLGASTGIGRAAAEALLARGHTVWATARRPETLADLDNAGDCLTQLLALPWYRAWCGDQQQVMVGYSDSAKELCIERGIGLFMLGEFMGAINLSAQVRHRPPSFQPYSTVSSMFPVSFQ